MRYSKDQEETKREEVTCPHCKEKFDIDVTVGIVKPDVEIEVGIDAS